MHTRDAAADYYFVTHSTAAADLNNDGSVSLRELREFVATAVAIRTEDRQHPVVDRDNLEIKFGLPRVEAR